MATKIILDGAIAPVVGNAFRLPKEEGTAATSQNISYQLTLTGTGVLTATVIIEVSNDRIAWDTLATFTTTGTDLATDMFTTDTVFEWRRADLTNITGTGAAVTVTIAT